MSQQKQLPVLN